MPPKKQAAKKAVARLRKYRDKRNFQSTPEPTAKVPDKSGRSFVVQEHHARSHHYDFRLEIDGVLVSWAVPKGIPHDTVAKRLAVHVEDHPLEYGGFEGTIPEGNYGAGTVAIWDKGIWKPLEKNWRKSFQDGKLTFVLQGDKLQGVFLLARMNEEPNWLMRMLEKEAPIDHAAIPLSENARFISPQLARVVPTVPTGKQWQHEIKYDGYRLIAVQRKGTIKLHTRSGLDWTTRFKALASEIQSLTKKDFVIDGEAVLFDEKGRSRFGDLQAALQQGDEDKIQFVAFDLLHHDGKNLRELPLSARLDELQKIIAVRKGSSIQLSKTWPAEQGKDLFKQACMNGLEGIISKDSKGRYREGSRRDWTKSKCRARQEFVICGYTQPQGRLPAFGALVLGSYENNRLVPRGKVGTGFSAVERKKLLKNFKPLITQKSAFGKKESGVTWLEPRWVAEIEFAEITRDGSIRQGSFLGLREDKQATAVHLDPIQIATVDDKNSKVLGITISHPERLVYPDDQITKLEVARYYERVGEWMMPFVARRPLAVLRAPEGMSGDTFFQKSFNAHLPPHVFQQDLPDATTVFTVRSTKGLVALAQFGALEFHLWGARLPKADHPDFVIWDLDPDPAVPWEDVQGAALLTRDFLLELGLNTVVKTSGGKGLHVILHIKKTHDWETVRQFSKAVAQAIAAYNPKRFIVTSSKVKRTGKIFIDWMRNGEGATCVAPWSIRARAGAPVSMPINWAELPEATAAGFTIREPSSVPSEWSNLKPQTLTKATLRKLGIE